MCLRLSVLLFSQARMKVRISKEINADMRRRSLTFIDALKTQQGLQVSCGQWHTFDVFRFICSSRLLRARLLARHVIAVPETSAPDWMLLLAGCCKGLQGVPSTSRLHSSLDQSKSHYAHSLL